MSSTFGKLFKVTTFGESHGKAIGAVIEGCPSKMTLSESDIQVQLDRRKPGQSRLTTPRKEEDRVIILSGLENGKTLGTPIALMIENKDQKSSDYQSIQIIPRPSHADYTYQIKYGIRASSGGGRASARETIGRVAAGAIAEKYLFESYGIEIIAWVDAVGEIQSRMPDLNTLSRKEVDSTPVRCPDSDYAGKMISLIEQVKSEADSIGGIIGCVCRNVPAGIGEPVFDKLSAALAHSMLSIPACKGFEIGSGFAGTQMRGSQHNDVFIQKGSRIGTLTNYSGGIQGGISNGEPIYFRVAFKPVATIGKAQNTVDFEGKSVILKGKGRHDPCVVPRAVPIIETMAALVLADFMMIQKANR